MEGRWDPEVERAGHRWYEKADLLWAAESYPSFPSVTDPAVLNALSRCMSEEVGHE